MNTHEDLPNRSATVPADAFGLAQLLDVTDLAAYLGVRPPWCSTSREFTVERSGGQIQVKTAEWQEVHLQLQKRTDATPARWR
jgi:hypothetical protein